ncbi:hypothetical protein [Sulfuracidifex tepidarius]|uniref:Dinitrogenase iron-molybdenum cofactor biosynthesis domain-containing protein n=1 Tax=Sulfuracidifex tepidarius TaxID=1294262 RepID=A0A510DRZ2_9CREN|nr:hypothetical protein [Sulfuracidifex tepidarius]BBG22942.1 hypothetical protein IC006_0226 [Sulfuracidifex tepidarius]BBG25702.1 hypothetical protein IC007_0207 [Sulfuracidifex tepidarius]
MICTTVDKDMRIQVFSKGELMILYDPEKKEVVYKEDNVALKSKARRPEATKECIKLKADTILGAHGSFCFPSFMMGRKAGKKLIYADPGTPVFEVKGKEVTISEVLYSSFTAMKERLTEHHT